MKTLFTSILFFLLLYVGSLGQWVLQNPLNYQLDMRSVNFIDSNNGMAVGDYGYIFSTSDGGINWSSHRLNQLTRLNAVKVVNYSTGLGMTAFIVGNNGFIMKITFTYGGLILQTSNTNENLHSIFFTSDQTGYCSGNSGTILKTTDGGTSWVTLNTGTTHNLHSIYFTDSSTGYAAGGQNSGYIGIILKTTDAGNSWKVQYSGISNKYLYSINFANSTTGWACGWNGTILKTTNGGKNWYSRTSGVTSHLRSICFKGLQNGNAVGADGTVLKTDNGGAVWTKRTSNTKQQLNSVFILNDNSVTAAGNTGTIIRSPDGKSGWKVYPVKNLSNLKNVVFKIPKVGYINADGLVYKTTDKGLTWTWIKIRNDGKILTEKLFFVDYRTGWALSNNTLYKTINGGVSWAKYFEADNNYYGNFISIFFIDNSNGWIAGHDADLINVFYTNNGGKNWVGGSVHQDGPVTGPNVFFKDKNVGFLTGSNPSAPNPVALIYSSVDGGKNWNSVPYYFPYLELSRITDITSSDHQKCFFIGGYEDPCIAIDCDPEVPKYEFNPGSMIISTTDGGNSWIRKDYNLTWTNDSYIYGGYRFLNSISFATPTIGYTVGNGILKTTDGGENWFVHNPGFECYLNSVDFADANNGWAVGESGVILKYQPVNKLTANTEETDLTGKLIPKEFTLHQNYPNPFNPSTTIKFDLPENSSVNLSVYSILGERVAELINGEMEAGYHEIDFNAGDYSSGIYFYRIDTDKNHAVKKMLLLK